MQKKKFLPKIANKIKKSKQVQKKSVGNDEMYCFDDTDVVFNTVKGTLTVKKDDEVLVSFDCNWDAYDKNAQMRSVHFSGLLEKARNAFAKARDQERNLAKGDRKSASTGKR